MVQCYIYIHPYTYCMCGFHIYIKYVYTLVCMWSQWGVDFLTAVLWFISAALWSGLLCLWHDSCRAAYSKQEDNEVEVRCGSLSALFVLFLESRSDGSYFNKEEAYLQGHSCVCSSLWTFMAAGAVVVNWTTAFSFERIPLKGRIKFTNIQAHIYTGS